ncbi:hypothetical protein [Nocardia sp. NPDC004260]
MPTSLYLYYDKFDVLLYVGITSRGIRRNHEHNADKEWWRYVSRQEVRHLPSRDEARRLERELIIRLRPPFNRQHNPGHEELAAAYRRFIAQPSRRKKVLDKRDGVPKEPDWKNTTPVRLEVTGRNGKFLHCQSCAEDVVLATRVDLEATPFDSFTGSKGHPVVGRIMSLTRERQYGFEMVLKGGWLSATKEVIALVEKVGATHVIQTLRIELEHHSLLVKPGGIADPRKANWGKFSNGVGWMPQVHFTALEEGDAR